MDRLFLKEAREEKAEVVEMAAEAAGSRVAFMISHNRFDSIIFYKLGDERQFIFSFFCRGTVVLENESCRRRTHER